MKAGLTLPQMAQEIERQNAAKRDFIADTRKVSVSEDMQRVTLINGGPAPIGTFGIRPHAHRQLAERLDIPQKYYDRLLGDHPDLLANNVNNLLTREPARRMIRVLDDTMRAVVSDRYRPLDNYDLAQAVLPVLAEAPEMRVESSQFTETRFYLKVVLPRIEGEVQVGDVVQAGVSISNSEVGAGQIAVQPLVYRLWCKNGLVVADGGLRRYHVGKRAAGELDDAYEMFSEATRQLDDAVFWAKVRDTVRGVMKREVFERLLDKLRDATRDRIKAPLAEVVEVTAKRFGYNQTTSDGILQHLAAGGDLSRYGLLNALTRQSQDEADYDLASQLEMDGGSILELPRSDWAVLAEAA